MMRLSHRSVSFVDRIELEFQGNHFCQALSLGDVDGDGVSLLGSIELFYPLVNVWSINNYYD